MKKLTCVPVFCLLLLVFFFPCFAQADWVASSNGYVPQGAQPQGYEANGDSLWIARCRLTTNGLNEGTHIGKVRPGLGGARIPWAGREIKATNYDVWVGPARWVRASNGQVPQGAIPCGSEKDGTYLYAARGIVDGGLHIGKVRPGFSGANLPYGDREVTVPVYEVLCY